MTTHLRNACIGALLIASSPVHALGLGDATVRSGLGERLLIEIPLTAEPATDAGCFDVTVTGAAAGLIRVERLPGALVIRSTQRVREPLLGLEVHARCPGEPNLTRSYTLFVDPPTRLTLEDRRVSRSALAPLQPARSTAPPATRPQPAADGQPGTTDRIAQPIDPRGRYTVTAGDTAWTIVERAVNGSASWQLIDDLVAANPDAFVNGDRGPPAVRRGAHAAVRGRQRGRRDRSVRRTGAEPRYARWGSIGRERPGRVRIGQRLTACGGPGTGARGGQPNGRGDR